MAFLWRKPKNDKNLYRPAASGDNVICASDIPKYVDIGNLNFEGKFEEAIEVGEKLLAKKTKQAYKAGIYINLMVSYFKLRNQYPEYLQKSSDCARMAILLGHNTGYAHERLAINLEKSGMIHQAIQLCDLISHKSFRFSKNGCGNYMDFEKRKNRLIKKISKAIDTADDVLFAPKEVDKILSYKP